MPTEYSKEIINQFIPGNGVPSGSMPAVRDDITRYGGGMMLSGVINDNGEIFNFFNKNHHVSDSGKSFMYDIMEQSGMGEHSDQSWTDNWTTTYGSKCIEQDNTDYRPSNIGDPEDPNIDIFLNSNQIIDLAANSEIALDLGNHIDHNDDNCFYGENSDTIIDSINHGGIYQFCILFPMYYYEINTDHPDWWKMSSPYFGENMDLDLYPSRQSDRYERLWYNAVTSSVNNGTRQWVPESSYYYITDYLDGYSQGNVLYHPYQTYKVPGLVFECYKQCRSSNYYVIQSLNEFDDHQIYQVSEAELNLILRGVQYGLRVFAEACIYDYGEDRSFTNMMRYLIDLDYPNNPDHSDGHWFRRTRGYNSCEPCRYNVFSLDEPNTDLINGDPDSVMMQRYLEHMGTVEIDGNTYPTDSLDSNGDPYEEYKFPVFVTCTGDQGFDEDIELDDLSGESELEIIKNWMDDSCRAVRPPYIEIDLYILLNNSPVYFKTLRMTESDRVDERTWRRVFTVPRYINGNPITYIVQERNIYAYDDNHSRIGNVPVYDISYSNTFDGGILGGLVVFGEELMYTISITNTANTNNIEGLGEIYRTVHITKVWEGFEECDSPCNCRAEASGVLFAGGESFNWDTDHHPIGSIDVTGVLLKNINTGNYITETPGSSWFSVISHSDSYLEWQVTNICNNYSGHPIDDSDKGGVFFFEIDQECIDLADDNMVQGFGVSGNWRQPGSRPLVYKICYHPDDFTEYTHGSVDYYKWLNEGWTPYIPGNNLKDDQGNLTAGSEYESITPRKYSGEDIIVPYNANFAKETGMKARIYIAAERPHHDSLGTFELSTFSFSGNQSYNKYANNVPYPNNQSRSVPLRCGGYINSLYGISMNGEELWNDPENIQDGDVRLGVWNNWVNTKWLISNIRVNGSNKYSKQYVFSNTKASDYGNARVDDWIHSKREFRLSDIGYGTNYIGDSPERWALGDIQESEVVQWYDGSNQDSTESYSNNLSDNIGGVLKGGMYSRLFEGNHNLVDASQLVIPLPYCDLMYFRTFADTGLIPGNTTPSSWISSRISTSAGIRKNEYYPQWASPEDSSKVPQFVFGALKGMYAGCKRIVTAYPNCIHAQYTNDPNNPLVIGMHYFDSMFSGVTGLRTCYMFKPIEYSGSESGDGALGNKFPWGACMNMFANTHGCWYNIIDTYGNTQEENWNPFGDTVICQIITDGEWFGVSMVSNAIKVDPHAFRGMFQSSNACYYTYHNDGFVSHPDAISVRENFPELHTIPAFVYANMFNGSSTNYPLGHSEVGDGSATHTTYHGGIGFDTKLGPGVEDTGAGAYIGHIGKGAFWGMFKDSQIRYCTFGGVGFYSGDFITYDNWAFGYMFDGCTKLGYINGAFKLWSSEGISHKKWVRGVTNNKSCTFMRNGENVRWPIIIRGNSCIPSKWSVVPGVGEAHVGQNGWDPVGNQSVGWQHGYVL